MRILHMIPDIGISNGVMSVILNYAKAMPDDIKFDVIYFAEKDKTRKADIEALGGRVYKTDVPSPKSLLSGKMSAFFRQHKGEWQALHIHCPHFAVFIAPFAKAAGIKKIAVHCHSTVYSLKGSQKRNQLLSLYAKYFIKTKIACSNEAGRLWYGGKKYTVLNNGIDCDKYKFSQSGRELIRKELNIEENGFAVGHIGRTNVPQKNHPFILKVFAEIKKQKDNSVLLLAGAEESAETKELAKKLGIENSVYYLGVRQDVNCLLSAMDTFIFPSTKEGLPVSVIEAQASGLNVLISDSVTAECAVTELAEFKSLDESPSAWASAVIHNTALHSERSIACEKVKSAGWDIYDCADKLIDYYKN